MISELNDKSDIEAFLRKDVFLHIYELGDLDDFFWPNTRWYGLKNKNEIKALVLLYSAFSPPIFLALASHDNLHETGCLIAELLPRLPKKIYAHLSSGLEKFFRQDYVLNSYGTHLKMGLRNGDRLSDYVSSDVRGLTFRDLPEIHALYSVGYPDNAFDPRMLETKQCFGLWRAGQLVTVAGVHVYSPVYRVAALGNIATHPAYRNQGLGKIVTATLCKSLLERVEHIGLNVKADNAAAVQAYQSLGFEVTSSYQEILMVKKTD